MKDTRNSYRRDWLPTATFPEGLSPWPAGGVSWGEAGASGMSLDSCQQTQSCHHPNPTRGQTAQLMCLDTPGRNQAPAPKAPGLPALLGPPPLLVPYLFQNRLFPCTPFWLTEVRPNRLYFWQACCASPHSSASKVALLLLGKPWQNCAALGLQTDSAESTNNFLCSNSLTPAAP